VPACLLAWLVPGAGHFYLRRNGRGLLFLATIGALFVIGVSMDARLQVYLGLDLDQIFELLRTVAQFFTGVAAFIARAIGYEAGQVTSVTHEYGNTLTEVAGLLNILVILDAHDIAVGRKL